MRNTMNYAKISLSSRSCNEAFARTSVAAFAAALDPTLDEIIDVKTAVSEAVTNCVVHAYKDRIGSIYITMKLLTGKKLEIVVRDRGCGIENIEKAMEPTYTTDSANERAGLGFSVMATFMDTLRVHSSVGKGTVVTMTKRIGKAES